MTIPFRYIVYSRKDDFFFVKLAFLWLQTQILFLQTIEYQLDASFMFLLRPEINENIVEICDDKLIHMFL